MSELEWWATAPEWANYHTWDRMGKCWWRIRPEFDNDINGWVTPFGEREQTVFLHDMAPLPVELDVDPSTTLRKRPKAVPA